eukprot:TRINITY_DN1615_c0_g1_i4.p1 TRINITY_DN1615_c0_g1~~TRINITY_DN1615_c0_g1_i4.p1  ORF type:complete len:179 (-),score=4.20 TRINITY_DN1615_c0_g1_i4:189-725(-)
MILVFFPLFFLSFWSPFIRSITHHPTLRTLTNGFPTSYFFFLLFPPSPSPPPPPFLVVRSIPHFCLVLIRRYNIFLCLGSDQTVCSSFCDVLEVEPFLSSFSSSAPPHLYKVHLFDLNKPPLRHSAAPHPPSNDLECLKFDFSRTKLTFPSNAWDTISRLKWLSAACFPCIATCPACL